MDLLDGTVERWQTSIKYELLTRVKGARDWCYLDEQLYSNEIPDINEWVCSEDERFKEIYGHQRFDYACEFVIVKSRKTIAVVEDIAAHTVSASW